MTFQFSFTMHYTQLTRALLLAYTRSVSYYPKPNLSFKVHSHVQIYRECRINWTFFSLIHSAINHIIGVETDLDVHSLRSREISVWVNDQSTGPELVDAITKEWLGKMADLLSCCLKMSSHFVIVNLVYMQSTISECLQTYSLRIKSL